MRTLYPAKLKPSAGGDVVNIPLDLQGLQVARGSMVTIAGSDTTWRVLALGKPEQRSGRHVRCWVVETKVK